MFSKTKSLVIAVSIVSIVLTTAIVAFGSVSAGNTGWTWSNPRPQGNTLSAVAFVGSRGYAGGDSGTLLRSDDAGSTWSGVRTGILDDVRVVRAISTDVVVFAGRCALRRSDDGGVTVRRLSWTTNDENCDPQIQSFSFPSSGVGFLLLTNGDVYTSEDSGDHWRKVTAVPGTVIAGGTLTPGAIHFLTPTTGFATAGATIYRTVDGGQSWTPRDSSAPGDLTDLSFPSATVGYAVGKGKAVVKTTDGGDTWSIVAVGAGEAGVDLRAIDCANVLVCAVAATNGSALFRSSDGGATWLAVSPSTTGLFDAGYTSGTRLVAIGAGGATVASDDGGSTWATISTGVTGSFESIRAIDASTAYSFGENGALARTLDGGETWKTIGVITSARINDVAFPSPTEGFVIDANGSLTHTVDGGNSWLFIDTGTRKRPTAIAAPTPKSIVLVGPKGIRISIDSGVSFKSAPGRRLRSTAVDDLDRAGSVLFAYGARAIFISTDGGKHWSEVRKPAQVKTIADLDFVSANRGYLLDNKGELWTTARRGKKWSRVETTGDTDYTSMAFGSAASGYLAGSTGRILHTANAGKTWSRQYPFFDSQDGSPLELDAPSSLSAFAIVGGTSRFFDTDSGGAIGNPSLLNISAPRKVKKNTTVRISGRLSPASGGERVSVIGRPVGAKSGARWTQEEVTVAANGSFTAFMRVKKAMIFIARWSGSSSNDGVGARAVIVKLKNRG